MLALVPAFLTQVDSWPVVLAFFSWAMFIAVGFIVMSLHLGARAYPRDQTGMVAGVGSGAWSAVVAILLPIYGRWFDQQMYAAIFISLSVIPILGTGCGGGSAAGSYVIDQAPSIGSAAPLMSRLPGPHKTPSDRPHLPRR